MFALNMRLYLLLDLRNSSLAEGVPGPRGMATKRPLPTILFSPASAAAAAVSAQPKELLAILLVPTPQKNMAGLTRFRAVKGEKTVG